jgi:outer membrane receptor protein involved in Fe transport
VLGENFDYAQGVEELPIQNRNLNSITTYAPNVAYGPTPDTLSISGAPSFDNSVLLDGSEISDPYFSVASTMYFEDSIEEVQVLTSGVSPRYGRFQGGVINAITKTGGNTFDGTVRVELRNQRWNSQTPFGEDQSDDLGQTFQMTLGGYILKDHLWFFLGGRTRPDTVTSNSTVLTGQSFESTEFEDRWQVKLRGAATPDHVVEIGYLERDYGETDRAGLPPGELRAANGTLRAAYTMTVLAYQGVLTPSFFLDFQATRKETSGNKGGEPNGRSPFADLLAFAFYNNHWFDRTDTDVRDNETLGLNLIQALSTSNWGSHTLEYGAQWVNSITGGENRQSPTGLNLLAVPMKTPFAVKNPSSESDPVLFNLSSIFTGDMVALRWDALAVQGHQEIESLGVYIHDAWEIDRWRFDIGLRWDAYDGTGPLATQRFEFSRLAPRLGVTYNVSQDWQVQTTWGRYVSRFNDNVFTYITGVAAAPYVETRYTGPEFELVDATTMEAVLRDTHPACQAMGTCWGITSTIKDPEQPTQFLASDITAPYADDFNFSVRHALPRNSGSLVLAIADRRFKGLIDDFVGGYGFTTVTDPDPSDPNNPASFTFDSRWWANAAQAERRYTAATLVVDWRPSPNWGVGGNYTFAQTQGNYEGEAEFRPASGSQIGNWVESRPESTAVPYGLLDVDIPHRLRAWGNYRWNFDRAGQFVVGSVFTYESGRVWNRVADVSYGDDPDYLDDSINVYTHYFEGRGSDRFDGWWRVDLSGRYQFPIWKRLQGWLKVDVLNFTNESAVTSYLTSASAVTNTAGVLVWEPNGNCGPGKDPWPSTSCSQFGRIRNEDDYQQPRTYLFTIGLTF